MNHPVLNGRLPDLNEFLHIIQCDECEAKYGDATLAYGQALVQAATIMQASN